MYHKNLMDFLSINSSLIFSELTRQIDAVGYGEHFSHSSRVLLCDLAHLNLSVDGVNLQPMNVNMFCV